MKVILNRLTPAAMAALLALPAAALAQSSQAPAPAAPQGAPPPAAASSPMAGHAVLGKNAEERVEHRIDELHAQLRITPAEQQQWNQFAEVMRDNARDMDKAFMQRAEQFQSMNALQNMESYEQIAEAHAQHLQTLVPAFQNLYSAMPDQQKRLADQVFRANAEQRAQHTAQAHRNRNG
ncbi:MAG TPA: Spy/CpxP family protein refolding chaperone [Stellaceae bacterium]|nr:Spy/CpxP family protein refolding chaperone [Stellaceae bacterium]HMD65874.1 Spy/CpxP family protein refolding chaperone [Stellaceae bacterium]